MSEPMTDQEIREIEALAEKATAGPWKNDTMRGGIMVFQDIGPGRILFHEIHRAKDAAFIAASRTAVPRMAGEIRRLTRENSDLRAALDLERKGDPLSAEVERLREALKGAMVVAETAKGLNAEVERLRVENEVMIIGGYNDTLRVQSRRTYKKLRAENASLRAELEAAKEDMHLFAQCVTCVHTYDGGMRCRVPLKERKYKGDYCTTWQWRGLTPANCEEQGAPEGEPIPGIGSEKPSH